jgi:hypothetical protein
MKSTMSDARRRLVVGAVLCAAIAGGAAQAADTVWLNVENFPGDLATTQDAWSAVRMDDPAFISNRVAADDFVLTAKTTITKITFYGAIIGEPQVLGGDWYIFKGAEQGPPQTLVAFENAAPMVQTSVGVSNPAFGPVLANEITMNGGAGVTLEAGHYFLAFRTYQAFVPGNKNNNGAFTTRWANGTSRAWWNFELAVDGVFVEPWVLMQVFNLVQDQEWAFRLEGEVESDCAADCDGNGTLNIDDFVCFQTLFALGEPGADCDGSGALNIDDFICFQTLFALGC